MHRLHVALIVLLSIAFASPVLASPTPTSCPHLRRVAADLDLANQILLERSGWRSESTVVASHDEIEIALGKVRRTEEQNRIDPHDPGIPKQNLGGGPFDRVIELLDNADNELRTPEDAIGTLGWRDETLGAIADARRFVLAARNSETYRLNSRYR